jgi:hypothetical protein
MEIAGGHYVKMMLMMALQDWGDDQSRLALHFDGLWQKQQ